MLGLILSSLCLAFLCIKSTTQDLKPIPSHEVSWVCSHHHAPPRFSYPPFNTKSPNNSPCIFGQLSSIRDSFSLNCISLKFDSSKFYSVLSNNICFINLITTYTPKVLSIPEYVSYFHTRT